jgi:hypothetical protein
MNSRTREMIAGFLFVPCCPTKEDARVEREHDEKE